MTSNLVWNDEIPTTIVLILEFIIESMNIVHQLSSARMVTKQHMRFSFPVAIGILLPLNPNK